MAQRLRMEAVQQRTSKVSQVLQTKLPNTHLDKWFSLVTLLQYIRVTNQNCKKLLVT